jgi:hypothetical protein
LRPQKRRFLKGKLKAEILRKTVGIAPNCFVEALGQNAIEHGEIAIEDDALAADGMDGREFEVGHVLPMSAAAASKQKTMPGRRRQLKVLWTAGDLLTELPEISERGHPRARLFRRQGVRRLRRRVV